MLGKMQLNSEVLTLDTTKTFYSNKMKCFQLD